MKVRIDGHFAGAPREYEPNTTIENVILKTEILPPGISFARLRPFQMGGPSSPYIVHSNLGVGETGFTFRGSARMATQSEPPIQVPYDQFPSSSINAQIDIKIGDKFVPFDCVINIERPKRPQSVQSDAVNFVRAYGWYMDEPSKKRA